MSQSESPQISDAEFKRALDNHNAILRMTQPYDDIIKEAISKLKIYANRPGSGFKKPIYCKQNISCSPPIAKLTLVPLSPTSKRSTESYELKYTTNTERNFATVTQKLEYQWFPAGEEIQTRLYEGIGVSQDTPNGDVKRLRDKVFSHKGFFTLYDESKWSGFDRDILKKLKNFIKYGPEQHEPTNPVYGMPAYGAPAYGAPAYGAPAYGAPAYGTPSYGTPSYGAPAYGAPSYSTPAYDTPSDNNQVNSTDEDEEEGPFNWLSNMFSSLFSGLSTPSSHTVERTIKTDPVTETTVSITKGRSIFSLFSDAFESGSKSGSQSMSGPTTHTPVSAYVEYNGPDGTRWTAGGKPKPTAKYVKTTSYHTFPDGTKRVIYMKNNKQYVKKRDSATGKFAYVAIRKAKT